MPAGLQGTTTRPPAVAGLFYPGDPDRLRKTGSGSPRRSRGLSKVMPKALIAPHAGYVYSGACCRRGIRDASGQCAGDHACRADRTAHYVQVRGIAAPTVDAFETPLGRVPVDMEALSKIDDLELVIRTDAPHASEHALEVELPFLQTVLAILPIGAARRRRCDAAGRRPCAAPAVGRAGDADRGQLRSYPITTTTRLHDA